MNLFLSVFPIVLLIWLMVKKNSVASYFALPGIALLIYVLQLTFFNRDFTEINANVVAGLVATLTPITVIFGAILFNRMMELTGCIDVLRKWLANINPNPVAQLMIIGWAFAFMIEGASGFGTPAAIAAPILVGLGFPALRVAVFTLVMNSVPVSFGAVGTPTWFGFGPLKLSDDLILSIGQQTAFIHFVAGFIIPVMALGLIVSREEIRKNIGFVYLSVLACTIPYIILAQFNYEFPALVGGGIGLLLSVFFAKQGWGLAKHQGDEQAEHLPIPVVVKALIPLGILMGILVVTRIKQLGIKGLLNDKESLFNIHFGSVFDFEVSRALFLSFKNIFGTDVSEVYKTLYVPALIPFVVTVLLSVVLFKTENSKTQSMFSVAFDQVKKPFWALLGALIMVKLMMMGGDTSMVKTIGKEFAHLAGGTWLYFAPYLGAIGAFFSGSNTVSNLTFGAIQQHIAVDTDLSVSLILAMQSVGGAMGNMVCINNIIAVCSVLGIVNQEGTIIKKTCVPMFVYGIIAAVVAVVFLK